MPRAAGTDFVLLNTGFVADWRIFKPIKELEGA